MGNSNASKVIVSLMVMIFGLFSMVTYTGCGDNVEKQGGIDTVTTHTGVDGGQQAEEETLSAEEIAVVELCDCFTDILELRQQIEEDPRVEFELSSKIKKAEIRMRSCYIKAKQRHSRFGKDILENFEFACPDAQEEL
ncbi:MAG: hypothetical protein ACI97N_002510 [Cognaticolwellia sp.]|jgi:hypothetical protein